MAKFCGTCGFQNDDNAKICGNCGAMFPETKAPMGNPLDGIKNMTPEKKEQAKKYGIYAGAGVAGLIVLIIVISFLANHTGAKGAVNKLMKGFAKTKASAVVSVMAQTSDEFDKAEAKEDIADFLEEFKEKWEEEFDGKVKMSYKVGKKTKLSTRAINAINERLENNDAPKITKAYYYKVTFTVKRKGDSEKEDWGVLVVKQKGRWKVYSYYQDEYKYGLNYYKDLGKDD